MKLSPPAQSPGRPRAFCVEKALESALKVFWTKGYEGASLTDLTEAMGINRPSLYAAYGNKEQLFRKALDLYACRSGAFVCESLARPSAREAVETLLLAAVANLTCAENPHGCMTVRCTLSGSEAAESVRVEIARQRAKVGDLVRERLERAKADGDLPPDADPAALARYVATIMQGMSVQAAGGATCEQLRQVVLTALEAWPKSTAGQR